ncbi:MAG: transglutaminase domain-containing protein [Lachnospiraceae bacterium]|nr:transglutaminase domain-containing protein [Lachnospiraceae bacterium]
MKQGRKIIGVVLVLALFAGCIPQTGAAAKTVIYPTVASGELVKESDTCVIDYSNTQDGYVMAEYKESTSKTIKAQVVSPGGNTYTYTLRSNKYEALPLTEGDGTYKVTIFLNVSGNSYATVMSETIQVELSSQFAPYLRPNQYVNYKKSTKCVKKAASLTKSCKTDLAKVKKVYNWVIKNFKYDNQLAANVQAGYLPNLDKVYKKKKGICFDYAATMTAMLRSQGVPTKLVIGYTGNAYHAWINVYSSKKGWVTGAIYFNGKKWKLMDPTFASTGKSSKSIMKYIGNGKNYKAKYSY